MGLKKSDVLKDPAVQAVIKALEPLGCVAPTEDDLDRPPMLRIMIETDNLDGETAAILVAGKMTRGKFPEDYMPLLPEDLTTTLWILQDPDNKEDPARIYEQLVEDGNAPAMKIALAAVTARGTGPEFESLKATMNRSDLIQHANEIAEVATQLTSQVGENLRWAPMAQPALEAFYASVSNLSQLADGSGAREFREAVRAFKAQARIKDEPKPAATPDIVMRTTSIAKPMAMSSAPDSAPGKPSSESLQPEDVMDDPLVKKTVAALEEAGFGAGMRRRGPDLSGNPAVALLASMGALDSVTAAVLVAESMAAGSASPEEIADVVPAEVGEVLRHIGDLEGGMFSGLESGNITITKLAMAGISEMLTGRDIRELERLAPAERRMAMMEVGAVGFTAVDIADALKEHKLFDKLPAPLVERFAEGLDNLARLSDSNSMKRFFTEAATGLKEGMLKANSKDLTEPKPPEGPAPGAGPKPDAGPDAPKGPSSGSFKF